MESDVIGLAIALAKKSGQSGGISVAPTLSGKAFTGTLAVLQTEINAIKKLLGSMD